MRMELGDRSEETVVTYLDRIWDPQVRKFLPQMAASAEEALKDFHRTRLPGTPAMAGRFTWTERMLVMFGATALGRAN